MAAPDSGTLRIGFDDPFRPLAWSGDGRSNGPLLEMVAVVLETAGLEWTFVPLALHHSLGALANGEVDALAFKAIIPERSGDLFFTRPLMRTGAALFQLTQSAMSPRVIATPAKGPLAALLAKNFPRATQLLTDDYPQALDAVMTSRAHAAALNVHVGWYFAETLHPGRFVFPNALIATLDLAMAVGRRQGVTLRNRLDACVDRLHASGTLRARLVKSGVPLV